jgi:glycosyltransferase-like protein
MSHIAPLTNTYKIALFTYSTKLRGSVVHTLELAEALHQLGHRVCVHALSKDGQGFDHPLSCDSCLISARAAPSAIDALIHQRIQEFVTYLSPLDLDYDCYHAQDCISANALVLLAKQQRIPHVVRTVHHVEDYSSPYLQACQERSIRDVDLCLCVSDRWQMELQQSYQIHAPRVINGVNVERFSPRSHGSEDLLRERWGLSGSPIYLTIGGIEPRKNSLCLLEAFAQVQKAQPQAQLVIAGGATLFDYQPYRDRFFALAHRLGVEIGRALVLPGVIAQDQLPALYRLADAFVFPSVKEGWGLVVLEAIASGLPVITANQAPFTEFLTDRQALLVEPTSAAAIAQAMLAILQPDRAASLVHHSQAILSRYTWKTSAQMHIHHYQHLLATYA